MKIKILTDSSIAMPIDLIKENDFGIVPIKILWEERSINKQIDNIELFKLMEEDIDNSSPKTSQPSIGDFKKFFEESLKENDYVIYLAIGTGTSGAYNSAMQAKKFLGKDAERIHVIDSENLDGSLALICLKLKELCEKGFKIEEIIQKIEEFKKKLHLFGFVDSPDWLEKSGRLSSVKANIARQAQKMGIRPLMGLKNGKVTALGLKFKAKDKNEAILRELKDRVGDEKAYLVITHANIIKKAEELKESLQKDFPNIEILFITDINSIVGAHAGPKTLLFSFYLDKDNI